MNLATQFVQFGLDRKEFPFYKSKNSILWTPYYFSIFFFFFLKNTYRHDQYGWLLTSETDVEADDLAEHWLKIYFF